MNRAFWVVAAAVAFTGQASAILFDFNSGDNGFVVSNPNGTFEGPWTHGATSGVGASGGWTTEGQVGQANGFCTTDLTSAILWVGAGAVTLSFDHKYSLEADSVNWDGAAVYLSVNGGAFTKVTSFTSNGYNGLVHDPGQPQYQSQLAGEMAFTGSSGGVITSVANLGSFTAGDTIRVRFRAAFDSNTSGGSPDWMIDNVNISPASAVPEPFTMGLGIAAAGAFVRRRLKAKPA